MRRTIVQWVGSPVDEFHAELSRLYARASAEALATRHVVRFAYVAPGGTWQFPDSLDAGSLADADPLSATAGIARLAEMRPDVGTPCVTVAASPSAPSPMPHPTDSRPASSIRHRC